MSGGERIVRANGVDLCLETFGDRDAPAILLIAGAQGSMHSWEDAFCERLAAGPRYVIRYDHRDTGRSVTYEPGKPEYTGDDLVDDAVGILDALGLERAHVVGISLGGAIAQMVALERPERVASLTLISTSPAVAGERELPASSAELRASFDAPPPDWTDHAAVVDFVVASARPYAARSRPFDEEPWRELARRDLARSSNIAASANHYLVDGADSARRLDEISAPTLVLHGTEDPLFPFAHGEALAREIPGAELVALEQTGHELPKAAWDVAVPAILRHTAASRTLVADGGASR
jgi:pimeloyl-ACP methyl ester carboxylesterase